MEMSRTISNDLPKDYLYECYTRIEGKGPWVTTRGLRFISTGWPTISISNYITNTTYHYDKFRRPVSVRYIDPFGRDIETYSTNTYEYVINASYAGNDSRQHYIRAPELGIIGYDRESFDLFAEKILSNANAGEYEVWCSKNPTKIPETLIVH